MVEATKSTAVVKMDWKSILLVFSDMLEERQ
jgi:hypothetical protein